MPTNLFFELSADKQAGILAAGIAEFARYGYENSSTNRIVRACGISKGSLFKYFPTKEEMYFYILDSITVEMTADLMREAAGLSKEMFQRVLDYAAMEFSWYVRHTEEAGLILRAFARSDTELYQKTTARYDAPGGDIFRKLLQDVDADSLRWDKERTAHILYWFLKGFNEEFAATIHMGSGEELECAKNKYIASLSEYLDILKTGLIK